MSTTSYDNTKSLVFIENETVVSEGGNRWKEDEAAASSIVGNTPKELRINRVCLSGADGIAIVRNSDTSYNPLEKHSVPLRGKIQSSESVFRNRANITHLKGLTFISSGWRRAYSNSHPTHFLMAIGPIISYLCEEDSVPFDNIVLHQCSHLDFKFQSFVMKIFKRLFTAQFGDRPLNLLILPYQHSDSKLISCDEALISRRPFNVRLCGPFGSVAHTRMLQEVRELLSDDPPRVLRTGLTIGVFIRSGSNNGNRFFVNLDQVLELARGFSSNVSTFTTNETMDVEEQIRLFNSFDIIITPHNSSMVMSTFNSNHRHAAIEVVHKVYNDHCEIMAVGIGKYIISTGHLLPEATGEDRLTQINSDICVNLDTLSDNLVECIDYVSTGCT